HSSSGSLSFQALVLIATWTRPPLPTAMSQAEYSRPAACEPPRTTGMAAENVTPPSVDFAYFGPSSESKTRWTVPSLSVLATTGFPPPGTATVVTLLAESSANAGGRVGIVHRTARTHTALRILMGERLASGGKKSLEADMGHHSIRPDAFD